MRKVSPRIAFACGPGFSMVSNRDTVVGALDAAIARARLFGRAEIWTGFPVPTKRVTVYSGRARKSSHMLDCSCEDCKFP